MYAATRDEMLKFTGEKDPWAALKFLDAEGVEIHVDRELKTVTFPGNAGKPYALAEASGRKALAESLKKEGRRCCALLMANDFSNPNLDAEITWAVGAVRAAKEIGAPAVRIDVVPHQKNTDLDWFLRRAIHGLTEVLKATEDTGIALGIENHGHHTNDPAFLQKLFDGVGSERLGLTLDNGNFYWYGHPLSDVYKLFEKLAPRARHTHIKNIKYPAETRETKREVGWKYGDYVSAIDEGDIDVRRFAKILGSAGYQGALTLEDESIYTRPEAERAASLKRQIAFLKACAAGK